MTDQKPRKHWKAKLVQLILLVAVVFLILSVAITAIALELPGPDWIQTIVNGSGNWAREGLSTILGDIL